MAGTTREVVLVLGGTRSGKSALAERLAAVAAADAGLAVVFVATGPSADGDDPAWRARIAAHRSRRPPEWSTVEVPAGGDLPGVLDDLDGAAVVDSLGTWISGFDTFEAPGEELCKALLSRRSAGLPTFVVSEEVGLSVHPPTETGRRFADALGELNQSVAAIAGRVLLAVAGRSVELHDALVAVEIPTGGGAPE
jgi:adenosylcobinamide kinase / adenosylcobinamide-phosphate guanylyltransferase